MGAAVAVEQNETQGFDEGLPPTRLTSFEVHGLFGYLNHKIVFPQMDFLAAEPEVLIIEGQNGSGKTTIMKMIAGALVLDFDSFRNVPFDKAELSFSNGKSLKIFHQPKNIEFKIRVECGAYEASLASDKAKAAYTQKQMQEIEEFRSGSKPIIGSIHYDLLTIDRSLRSDLEQEEYIDARTSRLTKRRSRPSLSERVEVFLREAQVNYRRFFQAEDLELLPRMLSRFELNESMFRYDDMQHRLLALTKNNEVVKSFGLQTNDADLGVLSNLLNDPRYRSESRALSLIDSYLEMHENISKSRQLIADRLVEFERIMAEFLVGKTVKVNARQGLAISSMKGPLRESDLSSGEYHFLYMLVSALLCQRVGTILAIDEPELSLHVKWQRNLVAALSRCARGASPIFFLATHSTAISAQYAHKVQRLSAID